MSDELDRILSIEESALNKNKEISRILDCSPTDYFSILEINPMAPSTTSTSTSLPNLVKKLYRKKSLLIHPDKIDNPRAPEAFDRLKKSEYMLTSDVKEDASEVSHLRSIYAAYAPETPVLEFNDDVNVRIRKKVKEVLVDEENEETLRKLYKQTEAVRKDEERKSREVAEKIKRELKKNWEDERDVRVDNWRKYSHKVEKKQHSVSKKNPAKKKKKVLV